LIMTFMFDPAKLQMNWANANGTSIFRSDEAGTFTVAPSVMSMRPPLRPCEPALADKIVGLPRLTPSYAS
jgi:hypothetical protein